MPTSTVASPRTVIVCFPAGTDANWLTTSEVVEHHLGAAGIPVHRFPVRHRRLSGLITPWSTDHLLLAQRRFSAVNVAAGGRLARLDLTRVVAYASAAATA